jgi:hypothetical protein
MQNVGQLNSSVLGEISFMNREEKNPDANAIIPEDKQSLAEVDGSRGSYWPDCYFEEIVPGLSAA